MNGKNHRINFEYKVKKSLQKYIVGSNKDLGQKSQNKTKITYILHHSNHYLQDYIYIAVILTLFQQLNKIFNQRFFSGLTLAPSPNQNLIQKGLHIAIDFIEL